MTTCFIPSLSLHRSFNSLKSSSFHHSRTLQPLVPQWPPVNKLKVHATVTAPTPTPTAIPTKPFPTPSPEPPLQGPPAIFESAANLGATKMRLPWANVLLLGILAGAYISLGALLALSVGGNIPGILSTNPGLQKFIFGAIGLPIGLWLVVSAGGELFTGNVVLGTSTILKGGNGVSVGDVARNWGWSYVGNFIGSLLVVGLVMASGVMAVGSGSALTSVKIATGKVGLKWGAAFWRGVACNWLVCLAVYLASATKSVVGKFAAVWLPVSSFVAMGFDHSVANMFLIPMGMALGAKVSTRAFLLANLVPVTLGNIVGGALLVAFTYFLSYVKK